MAHRDQVVGPQLIHPEHPYLKTTGKRKQGGKGFAQHKRCHTLKFKNFLHENCSSMYSKPIYSPFGQNISEIHFIKLQRWYYLRQEKLLHFSRAARMFFNIMSYKHILTLATMKHRAKFLTHF